MDFKELVKFIDKPIVVYDLETSGLSVDKDEIISFYALRIDLDSSTQKLEFICKPTCPISPKASEVNGYTEESLQNNKPFKTYAKPISSLLEGCDLAGFNNSHFDDLILSRQMDECGYKDFLKDRFSFDVYKVYKSHHSRKLSEACLYYLGREITDAHTSDGDVKTTAEIILHQFQRENCKPREIYDKLFPTKEEFQHIIQNDKKEWVLNFSKHKGIKITSLDNGMVNWILKQSFINQVTKDKIKEIRKVA